MKLRLRVADLKVGRRLEADDWRLEVGAWCPVGGWSLVAGGWRRVARGRRPVAGGGWLVAVVGSWRLEASGG